MEEKTLYISDLDGTLLNGKQQVSSFTAEMINQVIAHGICFSYATARSFATASVITKGITANIPVIVYNGCFILDQNTGDILHGNFFDQNDFTGLLHELEQHDVYPILYAYVDGAERFLYLPEKNSAGMLTFLQSRKGDIRDTPVNSIQELYTGQAFYITCIDEAKKLLPLYERFQKQHSCVYHRDIYSGNQWLEIMPQAANKAKAALLLKRMLGCDRLVSFGDDINDIPLFTVSDACYAVENAVLELKQLATSIIESNAQDGVAKWLLANTT